jgi:Zn-dependent protease
MRYFRKPKRDMAITALAGPLANLLCAFLAVPVFFGIEKGYFSVVFSAGPESFQAGLVQTLFQFVYFFHVVSLGLCLFNLIPLPPLDGSRILFAFLPSRYYYSLMRYERMISLALMLFLLTGANFGFLQLILPKISDAMQSLWLLLPIF